MEFQSPNDSGGIFNPPPQFLDTLGNEKKISAVGLYCDYENVTENIFISRYIKETFNLPVIVGDPQATVLEEIFLSNQSAMLSLSSKASWLFSNLLKFLSMVLATKKYFRDKFGDRQCFEKIQCTH